MICAHACTCAHAHPCTHAHRHVGARAHAHTPLTVMAPWCTFPRRVPTGVADGRPWARPATLPPVRQNTSLRGSRRLRAAAPRSPQTAREPGAFSRRARGGAPTGSSRPWRRRLRGAGSGCRARRRRPAAACQVGPAGVFQAKPPKPSPGCACSRRVSRPAGLSALGSHSRGRVSAGLVAVQPKCANGDTCSVSVLAGPGTCASD